MAQANETKSENRGRRGTGAARYALIAAAAIATFSIGYAIARGDGPGAAESGAPTGGIDPSMTADDIAERIPELEARLRDNPDDEQGWALLASSYFTVERFEDAARAYARAAELDPTRASYHSARGEALVLAAQDAVPDAAVAAFRRALELDPADPSARYYLAARRHIDGDAEGAVQDWIELLRDTPPGAPWEAGLRSTIAEVAELEGIDVSDRLPSPGTAARTDAPAAATQGIPGPTREQMREASQLPQGQQDMMVENMVEGLDRRLQANPDDADGWIMLMRSRMQLGQTNRATQAWRSAREAFAGDSAQLQRINSAARTLGVPGA